MNYNEILLASKDQLAALQSEKLDLQQRLERIIVEIAAYQRIQIEAKHLQQTAKGATLGVAESAARLRTSPFQVHDQSDAIVDLSRKLESKVS